MSTPDYYDLPPDQLSTLVSGGGVDAASQFANDAASLTGSSGPDMLRSAFRDPATGVLAQWATTKRARRIAARDAALREGNAP